MDDRLRKRVSSSSCIHLHNFHRIERKKKKGQNKKKTEYKSYSFRYEKLNRGLCVYLRMPLDCVDLIFRNDFGIARDDFTSGTFKPIFNR